MPANPTLAKAYADFAARGWHPALLDGYRMEADVAEREDAGPVRHLFGLSRRPGWTARDMPGPGQWAITAAADTGGWKAVLCVEGIRTLDHRELAVGAGTWRDLPLPLMGLDTNTFFPHESAVVCGIIETITRDGNTITATGSWIEGENGDKYRNYVETQALRYVSIDAAALASEYIEIYASDGWDDSECVDWWERMTEYIIIGATIVPFPALPQALIVGQDMDFPAVTDAGGVENLPIVAALRVPAEWVASETVDVPVCPPAARFTQPALQGLTHMNVDGDGRVFGHVAGWGIPHIGFPGQPIYAPRSNTGYAYFMKAPTPTSDGTVRTGVLTMGTGHADLALGWRPAADHYDNTGSAIADLVAGEDEWGIWVSGSLRPGVTYAQLRSFLSSDVSGDWRDIGGNLELVGVLVVNVGGFPNPASIAAGAFAEPELVGPVGAQVLQLRTGARVRRTGDGQATALVAAAVITRDPALEQNRRLLARLAQAEGELAVIGPWARRAMAADAAARLVGGG